MRVFISYVFTFFILSSIAKSQSVIDSIPGMTCMFFQHTCDFVSSPLHYDKEEICDLLKVVTLTGISFFADKELQSFSQDGKHRSEFLSGITKIDRYYGDTKKTVVLLGGTLFVGLVTNEQEILNAGFMLTESVIFSNIITQSVKRLFGRERSEFTTNSAHFIGPNLSNDQFQSLPSGHSTTVFAMSTVAAGLTKNTYLKILCYTPAFLTSISRIYNNRHWLSDVMLGGLIGYYTGQKVLKMNGISSEDESVKINVGFNSVGISLQF
jgi:hypothetical protein